MNTYLPNDSRILILGRTKKTVPLPLFWTASGLEFCVDGSELWISLESDYETCEEWIRIELEGVCLQRLIVPKGHSRICVFRGLPAGETRHVRILKEVQPMEADEKKCLLIHSLESDGALISPPKKACKIEFVGDSLSSGEGLGGYVGLFQGGSTMYGLEGHYALKVADHFHADVRILSQSGWGVYSSCDNDLVHVMPKYYEQVCGISKGEKNASLGALDAYDFQEWQPDLVVVNLGSNDGFALNREAWIDPTDGQAYRQVTNPYGGVEKESALRFEKAVIDFLKKLRKCNPHAFLLWAYGMCDHVMRPYLESAIAQYKAETEDTNVGFQILPTSPMIWQGSSGHPGKIAHGYAADVLIDYLEQRNLFFS